MIPIALQNLIEAQQGIVRRSRRDAAIAAILELGVAPTSDFAEFYQNYKVTSFHSDHSDEQLCDVSEPSKEIATGTQFIREVWGLPESLICFTDAQAEGAFLYDRETGAVWDFSLATRDDFVSGKEKPRWSSFFHFLSWYIGGEGVGR